jgi:hypothetical protein
MALNVQAALKRCSTVWGALAAVCRMRAPVAVNCLPQGGKRYVWKPEAQHHLQRTCTRLLECRLNANTKGCRNLKRLTRMNMRCQSCHAGPQFGSMLS